MLERVYGRPSVEQLAALMARAWGLPTGECSTVAADSPGNTGPARLDGLTGPVISLTLVPGGGIEPPTRGFSVPCSTD